MTSGAKIKHLPICHFDGHIMTMATPSVALAPPNPNDPAAIKAHMQAVIDSHAPLFSLVNTALQDSIPKATNTFQLLGGPVDLGVHAAITRYLTKLFLSTEDVAAEDEEVADYELQQVANCGLCLQWKSSEVRILKATPLGVPKATSEARTQFYSSNQMTLGFEPGAPGTDSPTRRLGLVLLWSLDESCKYAGMKIACPRKVRKDGNVDCFWVADWPGTAVVLIRDSQPTQQDSELEEIRPVIFQTKAAK
jgi:hypothetical protein